MILAFKMRKDHRGIRLVETRFAPVGMNSALTRVRQVACWAWLLPGPGLESRLRGVTRELRDQVSYNQLAELPDLSQQPG